MVLRDRDANTAWASASDGTLEERRAYAQNWRGDVAAVLSDNGKMVEWVKYSAYGVPFALPAGDNDSDGAWDSGDATTDPTGYDVRWDADLDGDTDAGDDTHANSIAGGSQTLGRGVLSSTGVSNRKGYAGYERDPAFGGAGRHLHHVRYRVYDADLGRWLQRDPQGYSDGMSLYAYVQGMAVIAADPWGLTTCASGGCGVPKMPGTSGGGGLGPEQCAGGTCSIPRAPMPGGGDGLGPLICFGNYCTQPEPPLTPGTGQFQCYTQQNDNPRPNPLRPNTPRGRAVDAGLGFLADLAIRWRDEQAKDRIEAEFVACQERGGYPVVYPGTRRDTGGAECNTNFSLDQAVVVCYSDPCAAAKQLVLDLQYYRSDFCYWGHKCRISKDGVFVPIDNVIDGRRPHSDPTFRGFLFYRFYQSAYFHAKQACDEMRPPLPPETPPGPPQVIEP